MLLRSAVNGKKVTKYAIATCLMNKGE